MNNTTKKNFISSLKVILLNHFKFWENNVIKIPTKIMYLVLFVLTTVIQTNAQGLIENFDSGIPQTWTTLNINSSTTNCTSSSNGFNNSTAAYIDFSTSNIGEGNNAAYYLVTPMVTIPYSAPVVKFKTRLPILIKSVHINLIIQL